MGYHVSKIERGVLGTISKVVEEKDEFMDAHKQKVKILELVELSDMIGALEFYMRNQLEVENFKDFIKLVKGNIEFGSAFDIEKTVNMLQDVNDETNIVHIVKMVTNILDAIATYLSYEYRSITVKDLYDMSLLTKSSFEDGERT